MKTFLAILAACVAAANGSMNVKGQCQPAISPQTGFELSKYVGTWFEVYTAVASSTGKPTCVNEKLVTDNEHTKVTTINVNGKTNTTITGDLAHNPIGVFTINYKSPEPVLKYTVVSTDYKYAVIYNCENIDETNMKVYSRILSKEPYLSLDSAVIVNKLLDDNKLFGVKRDDFKVTSFWRGSCNGASSVPGVALLLLSISLLASKFL